MLELKNITQVFHPGTVNENIALQDISLSIARGEFVTIIGSNGAGKSTLFNSISGTFLPTSGEVRLHDRNVTKEPEYKRAQHIGRIFQNPLLGTAGNMSLEDNMVMAMNKGFKGLKISLNTTLRDSFREQLVPLQMGLEYRLRDNVGLLSGGQRQALTLLMMVMSRPDLILLDEHTAALDPKNAEIVLELTLGYIRQYDITAMMITHNMHHAIAIGDRLLMMDKGEIILDIRGEEKRSLTVEKLVRKFQEIRKTELKNDEMLLS
ncbi:MAG: ATP-binding cassette domain-containing protein [Spirochaetales bacterium]|nr:ATP-binding cassette domain-containing protein [Spirochaetales bacterium]